MLEDLPAADEITKHVDRLLRQAGAYGRYPTPVDDLVEAARLQRSADYVLDESLISKAPLALRGLLHSARHKIQGLLDRRARVIHVSPTIDNEGKQRLVLHETSHRIIPHQRDLLYADDNETLSPATNLMFEREANQAAAELLFQRNDFTKVAAQFEISLDTVRYLAHHYGSSFHAALRRYAETHAEAVAVLVLGPTPTGQNPAATWRRYEALASPAWTSRFGRPTWPTLMSAHRHPFLLGLDGFHTDEHTLRDGQGVPTAVQVETTQTPYRSFVLLWLPGRRRLLGRRKVIVPATNP